MIDEAVTCMSAPACVLILQIHGSHPTGSSDLIVWLHLNAAHNVLRDYLIA